MAAAIISAARLRELLDYDPETGVFLWAVAPTIRVKVGAVAGKLRHGYRYIGIDGQQYLAHRLAWLYVHGHFPVHVIDHLNGIGDDNRLCNLRDVPRRTNNENFRKAKVNNRLGIMGVRRLASGFLACLCVDGARFTFGPFSTPEEAHAAYLNAKRQFHAGCTI